MPCATFTRKGYVRMLSLAKGLALARVSKTPLMWGGFVTVYQQGLHPKAGYSGALVNFLSEPSDNSIIFRKFAY